MPLTPEEEKEFQQLHKQFGGLTPEEEAEFQQLHAQYGKEKASMLESGLSGAAQGITLGWADEIEAGVRSAISEESYDDTLQKVRDRYKEHRLANPGTYGVGAIGGGILGTVGLGIGGAAAKGVLGAARVGATAGAIEGAGSSEVSMRDDIENFAYDVGEGAVLGGVLGAGGEVLGKALKGTKKALTPSKLRESSFKLTPAERRARLESPSLSQLDMDAIKVAENLDAWGETVGKSLTKVQKVMKLTGKKLGNTSKDLPEIFGDDLDLTQKVLNTVDDHKARFKDSMMQNKYRFDAEGGEVAMGDIDKIFSNLHGDMDKTKNALASVRALRQNLQKELKSSDFMPGGRRSASKDAVYELQKSIRKLESDLVNAYKSSPSISPSNLNKLDAYEQTMNQYSKLNHLKDLLVKTEAAGGKMVNTMDGIALALEPVVGAAKKAVDLSQLPDVKLGVAKGIENVSASKLQKAAERLKIPVETVMKLLESGRITPAALAALEHGGG